MVYLSSRDPASRPVQIPALFNARQQLAAAAEAGSLRDADSDSADTVRLLDALDAIREEQGETLSPAVLVQALAARPGFEGVTNARRLAAVLNRYQRSSL